MVRQRRTAPADTIPVITAALDAAGVVDTVDFLTEAEHGFAPAGPRYDRAASEFHWERVHSLLRRNLCAPEGETPLGVARLASGLSRAGAH